MKDIGTYQGTAGLEKLLQEINTILANKKRAVIAIAGLPGSGKTYMVKRFVRLGFGNFGRKDILVIDDNTIYSTRFWRLKWEKIKIDKKSSGKLSRFHRGKGCLFFELDTEPLPGVCGHIRNFTAKRERARKKTEKKREKAPEKFRIQKDKNMIPMEEPFECPDVS